MIAELLYRWIRRPRRSEEAASARRPLSVVASAQAPPSFNVLVDEFRARRLPYREFRRAVKLTDVDYDRVRNDLQVSYRTRDLQKLSDALMVALAVPSNLYTDDLCRIALEREPLFGCKEMALEVLLELKDPRAFEPMLELCCRPDLEQDPDDWRKAVEVITLLDVDPSRIAVALEQIAQAHNYLRNYALQCLSAIKLRP